ncbi:hypothetical protein [Rhizobium sp. LjRoot254]|jgi:hypothetical protein
MNLGLEDKVVIVTGGAAGIGGALHLTGQWLFVDGGYTHLDRALAGVK